MALSIKRPEEVLYTGGFHGTVGPNRLAVHGEAQVTIGDDGLPEIAVSIPSDAPSTEVLHGAYGPEGQLISSHGIKWHTASVESPSGTFRVTNRPFLRQHTTTIGAPTPQPESLRLGGLRAEYEITPAAVTKYWMLPLYNLLWETSPIRFNELDGHPMWMSHNQPAPSESETPFSFPPPVIAFMFDGKPSFIQRVADYDQLKDQLHSGVIRRAITAVMVGEVGNRTFDFPQSDPSSWFPRDLLTWLSFAVGQPVGAPWIELYDSRGGLVRRIHIGFGRPDFRSGLARIDNVWNPQSIGHVLSQAQATPHIGQPHMSIPLQLLVESITHGGSLEYRKVQLSRAFELLARHFDLHLKERLLDQLTAATQLTVEEAISRAADELQSIAKSLSPSERTIVDRIKDRIPSAAGRENLFGVKVQKVADHFGLSDAQLLDAYFGANPSNGNSTWAGVLSMYRGAVMHEGFFAMDTAGGQYPLREATAVVGHLEDLLTRSMLTMINYEGCYRSMIRGSLVPVSVDWVNPSLDAAELGFGVDRSI